MCLETKISFRSGEVLFCSAHFKSLTNANELFVRKKGIRCAERIRHMRTPRVRIGVNGEQMVNPLCAIMISCLKAVFAEYVRKCCPIALLMLEQQHTACLNGWCFCAIQKNSPRSIRHDVKTMVLSRKTAKW